MTKIGFIGLGNMGLPMATNLVNAGHQVLGFDTFPAARERFSAAGGSSAGSVDDLAECEVIISMLPSGAEVRSIYLEAGLVARSQPDALFIDSSTIDVQSARFVAEAATRAGRQMIDAPVSGGAAGAQGATLTFIVGGDDAAFARAEPLLKCMGRAIIHAGPSGSGQAAKICNNMILGISMIAVCEALVLTEKLGLDPKKLYDVSSKSSGQCWALTSYCPVPGPVPTSPANNGYKPGFASAMMLKDLKLAQDAARVSSASTPLGAAAGALYELFVAQGHAGKDFSGIIDLLRGA